MTAGLFDLHPDIEPLVDGNLEKPYKKTELLDLMIKCLKEVEK